MSRKAKVASPATLERYVAIPAALGASTLGASVAERIALAVTERNACSCRLSVRSRPRRNDPCGCSDLAVGSGGGPAQIQITTKRRRRR